MADMPTASHPGHLCYVKATWEDSWVETPLLRCKGLGDQAAPAHAQATFAYRCGRAILPALGGRAADTAKATVPRPNLIGYYVRVDIPVSEESTVQWFGELVDVSSDRKGDIDGLYPSGVENYVAYGLTILLERSHPVVQTLVVDIDGGNPYFIDKAIPFNGGTDGRSGRDRVATANYDGAEECFTDSGMTTPPLMWTAANAVNYLLTNFSPKNASGVEKVPFSLASGSADYLSYELPTVDYDNQNLWQILNRLISRKRGLGFKAVVVDDAVEIVVFSHSADAITLPTGGEIAANTNTGSLNFSTAINIESVSITSSAIQTYDQVIARGNPVGSVFTVAPDWNLQEGWTDTQEAVYNAGASGVAGYDALTVEEKASKNADYRARDVLHSVFSHWRLNTFWNGKSIKLSDESEPLAVFSVNSNGTINTGTKGKYLNSGLRFANFLPLRAQVNYAGSIDPDNSQGDREYLKPFVVYHVPVQSPSSSAGGSSNDPGEYVRWVMAERLDVGVDSEDEDREHSYTVQTRLLPDSPGFALEVVGGQQHFIAADVFASQGEFDDIPIGQSLYKNDFAATVYLPLHQRIFARVPDSPTSGDVVRTLVIDVADAYYDRLIAGTVVGVDDAGELLEAAGGVLRNDINRLKDIATIAHTWYGTVRRTIDLKFKGITDTFAVGQLITSVVSASGSESINTVITSIHIDMESGITSLQTHYEELDFGGLV